MNDQKDRCQACQGGGRVATKYPNGPRFYPCHECKGAGYSVSRAGVSCAALVGASDSASGVEDRDLHARIEEAIQEAQYCYVIADKASEARWLERAAGMISRRLRIVGTNDMEPIAPTKQLSEPNENA